MEVKALMTFMHGALTMARGEVREIPEAIAADLEKASLIVRVERKAAVTPKNKAAAKPKNKANK